MKDNKKVFLWNKSIGKIDLSQYTHIRAYHACRTTNIESYIKEGIHAFDRKRAYRIVRDTLIQCGIEESEIERCFNEHWEDDVHHFNTVCANISKEEMINQSGHYLIYGSEFICGMAAELFCQYKLTKIGIPTLIECHIEKRKFPSEVLQWIEDDEMSTGTWDGGIYLKEEILADEIVAYTHPRKIYDPLLSCDYYW